MTPAADPASPIAGWVRDIMMPPAGAVVNAALERSALGAFVRNAPNAYQALETIHMVGHSLLAGTAILLALRIIGAGRSVPLQTAARFLIPTAWFGLVLLVLSGGLMFASKATGYAENWIFVTKIGLANAAVLMLALEHWAVRRHLRTPQWPIPQQAQWLAGLSIVIWPLVILAGRFIYTAA